jgi:hypothetical protein
VPTHGLGSRQDMPLPFELVVGGAAVAVLVSFVVLGLAQKTARPGIPLGLTFARLVNPAVA